MNKCTDQCNNYGMEISSDIYIQCILLADRL